jgi:Uma2 family endonuclease
MGHSRSVKLTYEDFVLFPDDGQRHELIDGEHYVTPSPSTRHQIASANLTRILGAHVRSGRLGRVFAAPFDVVLSDVDVVEPDLLFVSSARMSVVTDKHVRGAPDFAIEILSDSTRKTDEIVKRKLYERSGVQEYWVVDPLLETVKVYRHDGQAFARAAELSVESGDTLTSPLFQGLEIPLAEIFE